MRRWTMTTETLGTSALPALLAMVGVTPIRTPAQAGSTPLDGDAFVVAMFEEHGRGLVRLVRLFVDDRNAAEDVVQEAFIRLSRSVDRIRDPARAGAYLRSIALNLARDHNRRGLVSLRHRLPYDDHIASVEDEVVLSEDHRQVVEALRSLPHRQRDCLILRYYDELGIDDIADTLGISRNSVKTHLTRGMRGLEAAMTEEPDDEDGAP